MQGTFIGQKMNNCFTIYTKNVLKLRLSQIKVVEFSYLVLTQPEYLSLKNNI